MRIFSQKSCPCSCSQTRLRSLRVRRVPRLFPHHQRPLLLQLLVTLPWVKSVVKLGFFSHKVTAKVLLGNLLVLDTIHPFDDFGVDDVACPEYLNACANK